MPLQAFTKPSHRAGKIEVEPPFAAIDDHWGSWQPWAPLEALDTRQVPALSDGNLDQQHAFGFTSAPYRVDGVRTYIGSHTTENMRGTARSVPAGHVVPQQPVRAVDQGMPRKFVTMDRSNDFAPDGFSSGRCPSEEPTGEAFTLFKRLGR
jgi:hypothetical protein